jgi:hypothetical protein
MWLLTPGENHHVAGLHRCAERQLVPKLIEILSAHTWQVDQIALSIKARLQQTGGAGALDNERKRPTGPDWLETEARL